MAGGGTSTFCFQVYWTFFWQTTVFYNLVFQANRACHGSATSWRSLESFLMPSLWMEVQLHWKSGHFDTGQPNEVPKWSSASEGYRSVTEYADSPASRDLAINCYSVAALSATLHFRLQNVMDPLTSRFWEPGMEWTNYTSFDIGAIFSANKFFSIQEAFKTLVLLDKGSEGPAFFVSWEYARFHTVGKPRTHGLCLQARTAPTWPRRAMTTLEDILKC